MTSAPGFNRQAFFTGVDARRREGQLSWKALASALWEQSRLLNDQGSSD